MHPGRYVVTVRATDKNGTGLFIEWDIPVYIPETGDPSRTSHGWMNNGSCGSANVPNWTGPDWGIGNTWCF